MRRKNQKHVGGGGAAAGTLTVTGDTSSHRVKFGDSTVTVTKFPRPPWGAAHALLRALHSVELNPGTVCVWSYSVTLSHVRRGAAAHRAASGSVGRSVAWSVGCPPRPVGGCPCMDGWSIGGPLGGDYPKMPLGLGALPDFLRRHHASGTNSTPWAPLYLGVSSHKSWLIRGALTNAP